MSSAEALQVAIQAARAGRKEEARDLLIQIVEDDPQNEMAWIWLSGLVDSIDDRIIACENALTINPANEKVRAYLLDLQRQQKLAAARMHRDEAVHLLRKARVREEQGNPGRALRLARQAAVADPEYADAWLMIGRLSSSLDEQITALQNAYRFNPGSPEIAAALKQAQYFKANPLSEARHLEQLGKLDEALQLYQELAGKATSSTEFDHIYRQIIRIEGLQKENIRYVAPRHSIFRMALSWPLLYLSLALIQMGLNPFAHPSLYLWLGLPFVVLGSFLLSLAEVRARHAIWQKLFEEHGDGSGFARLVTAATGWFLILIPHILLVLDSIGRLHNFRVPPMPS